jgi:tryptophan synthase alpha chain
MSRLRETISRAHGEGRRALVAFLAAGDPDPESFMEIATAAVEAGVDILEVGLPFSDPLADGPVIQAAYARALEAGVRTDRVLELVERLAPLGTPIVIMAGWNPVRARGARFAAEAAAAGAAGLLVPDLLPEDAGELREAAARAGLESVFLAAPWGSPERLEAAARASTGFVYLLARRGVTGAGATDPSLPEAAARARAAGAPVAVGFGVSDAASARRVAPHADAVVVGSRLVADADGAYRRGGTGAAAEAVRGAVSELRAALSAPTVETLVEEVAP